MADKNKFSLANLKDAAQKQISSIDIDSIKEKASDSADLIMSKAIDAKDKAIAVKDDINAKLTELDRMLNESVTEYNDVYTQMNDKGVRLFVERSRAVDSIAFAESLVNSIANRPKTFEAEFDEIKSNRSRFVDSCEFADRELQEARKAATTAGAGLAAGATVAFMAPTAAMWVATTFGTASTGTAISTLVGVAKTNAALAWLGGGALSVGGGGVAAGNALLALSGPVGWTIAGATLLSTIILFTSNKAKINKQKNEEIESVKRNTETVKEMDAKLNTLLNETTGIRTSLNSMLREALSMYGADYSCLESEQKQYLGALVNNTKTMAAMLGKTLGDE